MRTMSLKEFIDKRESSTQPDEKPKTVSLSTFIAMRVKKEGEPKAKQSAKPKVKKVPPKVIGTPNEKFIMRFPAKRVKKEGEPKKIAKPYVDVVPPKPIVSKGRPNAYNHSEALFNAKRDRTKCSKPLKSALQDCPERLRGAFTYGVKSIAVCRDRKVAGLRDLALQEDVVQKCNVQSNQYVNRLLELL